MGSGEGLEFKPPCSCTGVSKCFHALQCQLECCDKIIACIFVVTQSALSKPSLPVHILCLQLLLPQGSYKSCFSQATGIYCETYELMIVHLIRQSSRMIMSALMLWTSYLYELLMTQSYCTPLFCHVCSTVAWCPKTNLICCAVETCSRDQGSVVILEVDL